MSRFLFLALFATLGLFFGEARAQMGPLLALDVNNFGAAIAQLKIEVPTGILDMTPDVSLSYNSQGNNSVAGVGWGVSGLMSIARCPHSDVFGNYAVNYTSRDTFCLNGQQLFSITGAYGATNTTYRTEIETFSRVTSYGSTGGGPTYFTVETKDGKKIEFGYTADSSFAAYPLTTVATWMVDKISDQKGNYISYIYNLSTSEQTIKSIKYTGNASQSLNPPLAVTFVYDTNRADKPRSWRSGFVTQVSSRLTNVQTFVGSTMVKDYRVSYTLGASTSRHLLSSISECNADGACRTDASVVYGDSFNLPDGFGIASDSVNPPWNSTGQEFIADFLGNGHPSVVIVGNKSFKIRTGGTGTGGDTKDWGDVGDWSDTEGHSWVGDFNGDGLPDIASAGKDTIYVKYGTGRGFTSTNCFVGGDVDLTEADYIWSADFNGDGYTDIAMRYGDTLYMFLGGGYNGCFGGGHSSAPGNWGDPEDTLIGDFNGDGMMDIASRTGSIINMKLANGSNFNAETWPTTLSWGDSEVTWVGDFNGDGLSDIATKITSGNINVFLSKGKGGFQEAGWTVSATTWGTSENTKVGDFNGDGLTDVVTLSGSNAYVHLSTGAGFKDETWPIGSLLANTPSQIWSADMDGDGRSDLYIGNDSSSKIYYSQGSVDHIHFIKDALSHYGYFFYSTKAAESPDEKYKTDTQITVVPTTGIVSKLTLDAENLPESISYTYGTAMFDKKRGFAGYKWIQRNDSRTDIIRKTTFNLAYPFAGLVDELTESGVHNVVTYLDKTFNYEYRSASSPQTTCSDGWSLPAIVYTKRIDTIPKDIDLAGTPLPRTKMVVDSIDNYGNVTSMEVEQLTADGSKSGFLTTIDSDYRNDTSKWNIGQLARRTTTRKSPAAN